MYVLEKAMRHGFIGHSIGHVPIPNQLGGHDSGQSTNPLLWLGMRSHKQNTWLHMEERVVLLRTVVLVFTEEMKIYAGQQNTTSCISIPVYLEGSYVILRCLTEV